MKTNILVTEKKYNGKYNGKYVAFKSFNDNKVIASGTSEVSAHNLARKRGVESPVIVYSPKKAETFLL